MTAIWFVVWWVKGFPAVSASSGGWFIWLCITVVFDFLADLSRAT